MKTVVIIPARLASNRLPNKPILEVNGKTLLQYTYERAKSTEADHVVVTSPDREIGKICADTGMTFFPSSMDCPSGTHRCAEVASFAEKRLGDRFMVINWQVDEPLVPVEAANELIRQSPFLNGVVTLTAKLNQTGEVDNPNLVKVVVSGSTRRCLWFSRVYMPGSRAHVGLYSYTNKRLQYLGSSMTTPFAKLESLEQLTWLELGLCPIHSCNIEYAPLSINTEADWVHFREIKNGEKEKPQCFDG